MNTKKQPDDGGPAFPSEQGMTPDGTWNQTLDRGMSMRDYFAAAAMSPMLVQAYGQTPNILAAKSYEIADALLEARKQ